MAALPLLLAAGTARATWSIVIVDTRTHEIAVASATCLTGFDLQANTPVIVVGVGGATAQSAVDSDGTNRTYIRDQFILGTPASQILPGLAARDPSHQSRQYGIVDTIGNAVTFSGSQDGAWAGGRTGRVGDLVYAVQGNVLTGQAVVDAAVQAIEITDGDLAERLMAAMEAARSFGGDGRCSCSQAAPTSCGAPPPNFNKSAHVGYMIVARIGDIDGSNGNYKVLGSAPQTGVGDTNGDGFPEFITASASGIGVLPNVSREGFPPVFGPSVTTPNSFALRGLAVEDVNGDGAIDALATDINNDRVLLFGGTGGLAFSPPAQAAAGDGPTLIATGDANHDGRTDIFTYNSLAGTISTLINTGAGFAAPASFGAPAGTIVLRAGDLDIDGDADLVVASSSLKQIIVLRNNDGTFEAETPFTFSAAPSLMQLADVNGDGLLDIVFCLSAEKQVHILRQNGTGYTPLAFATTAVPVAIGVADFDSDSLQDLVYLQNTVGNARVAILRGQEDGSFAAPQSYPVGFSGSGLFVADCNADGRPDVIVPTGGATITAMHNRGGGFNPVPGLAGGEYYLDLNIANQNANALDPVFQLREQFDQWAATMSGIPDGVRTQATFEPALVWANGASTSVLKLQGFDRTGSAAPLQPGDVTVESLAWSPEGSIGTPVPGPDGTVLVPITAGTACASETFRVRISTSVRPVTLTPDVTLVYTSPSDVNHDGFVNGNDYDEFADLFLAGDAGADVDANGWVNGDDFDYFSARYEAGC